MDFSRDFIVGTTTPSWSLVFEKSILNTIIILASIVLLYNSSRSFYNNSNNSNFRQWYYIPVIIFDVFGLTWWFLRDIGYIHVTPLVDQLIQHTWVMSRWMHLCWFHWCYRFNEADRQRSVELINSVQSSQNLLSIFSDFEEVYLYCVIKFEEYLCSWRSRDTILLHWQLFNNSNDHNNNLHDMPNYYYASSGGRRRQFLSQPLYNFIINDNGNNYYNDDDDDIIEDETIFDNRFEDMHDLELVTCVS